eukprot:CAMPEP_0114111226 /NCGR_PEP_ID=MMETSP0043_2-20121206/1741_1 /TAXON_ID=464988 /ORGANISM="Hemiselmis andersenii, Strain CCMP644" /LENGTH=164 /DNA_ID=CAMNT_0001203245 /DNA_START=105 /DNA_END=596 /DNA_ORIENTATION=+
MPRAQMVVIMLLAVWAVVPHVEATFVLVDEHEILGVYEVGGEDAHAKRRDRALLGVQSLQETGGGGLDDERAIDRRSTRFPIAGGVLMFVGLFLLAGACAAAQGQLHHADNQMLCIVIIGAACEVLATLLISPEAAVCLASLLLLLVLVACMHQGTRAACCPGK